MLVARDGAIEFRPDSTAVITVALENTSDEWFASYPGLRVQFRVANSYQNPSDGDLFLYSLAPHDPWEHSVTVPAADLLLIGHELAVRAEPFALNMRNDRCLGGKALEFSATIPRP